MTNGKNKDVLVIGGGIAGMQSALLLAEKDHRVYVLDSAPAIGGFFPLLDRTFPTNSCGVCFMSPKPPAYCPIYENDFHENIELLTNCDIQEVNPPYPPLQKGGQRGDFEVSYVERPRYVDIQKCTLCDECVEVCPVEVDRELGGGLEKRKAIYLPFMQAIPRCYVIDEKACTKCGECLKVCSPGAINLEEAPQAKKLNVGAIILGFGFEPFRGEIKGEYGLGRYKNVLSSIQYERMLSFSSSFQGIPRRLSDEKSPQKIAFIQCVGSRDPSCDRGYCSSICCMYATKQAMISKDRIKDLDVAVFYMDIRVMGKDYERYYERAKEEYGIRYLRSAISSVRELQQSNNLWVTYGLENGELKEEEFDMVVLSVGFTPPQSIKEMAELIGVKLNEYNFCETGEFSPTETSIPGIFVAGAFRGPQDIPETVVEACSAASDVSSFLDNFEEGFASPKHSEENKVIEEESKETATKGYDEIIDDEDILRIGVFICDNKGLLSEGLDVEKIIEAIKEEQDIVCVEKVDVTSLKQGLDEIEKKVADNRLNRLIIAGYRGIELSKTIKRQKSPLGPPKGGFGAYSNLIEYTNIGEQCANVHRDTPLLATNKAISLIRASIKKVKLATPRKRGKKELCSRVLVVGGGISGLSSSLSLAEQGMDVTLVEKDEELGGNVRSSYYTLKGSDVQSLVKEMVSKVEAHPKIEVLKGAELSRLEGSWGNYRSLISVGAEEKEILHGAVIFATGGKEVKPEEYLYGENERVITQREFERMLSNGEGNIDNAETVVMIQCVGSRDENRPYCSRVCCGHAIKNALKLKELNPEANIYVLYRDMRTYGFYEKYYHLAREKGVLFIRYDPSEKPVVAAVSVPPSKNGALEISFFDGVVGEKVNLEVDLLVLSTGIEPNDNQTLAELAGVELNEDGFFAEANPKSAPLDSVDRGKYFCGLCHSPNFIEGAICQGKATAARASALLWSGVEEYSDNQAYVKERLCSGCGLCVSACPYSARVIDEIKNKAQVLEDLCKGCGSCVISCPNGASQQYNFEKSTILDVLDEVIGYW